MTVKVMFSFPDQLAARMRSAIPSRERSKIAAILFEKEISMREQSLYLCAKELEENKGLRDEMSSWDSEFGEDGLKDV
ncbi:MAG TPA: hypothetical protein VLI69_03430 [Gammaproteobacteria bacterium]|nr:hypothetical protein [Gammaproteobacteria bacterium]